MIPQVPPRGLRYQSDETAWESHASPEHVADWFADLGLREPTAELLELQIG